MFEFHVHIECPHCGGGVHSEIEYNQFLEPCLGLRDCHNCFKEFWIKGEQLEVTDHETWKADPRIKKKKRKRVAPTQRQSG